MYGYGEVTLEQINNKLKAKNLYGLASVNFITKIMQDIPDRQVVFARLHNLKVNGQLLTERAVTFSDSDIIYVPVWTVAGAVNSSITWDSAAAVVHGPKGEMPGFVRGDVIYVTADSIPFLFGGQKVWNQAANSLEFNILAVYLNNKVLTCDIIMVDNIPAVPLIMLSRALGWKEVADKGEKLPTINGQPVPGEVVGGRTYIKLTEINRYFNTYVYWDQAANKIDLTYPSP